MENKKSPSGKAAAAMEREARLKAALKANMGRRKAQARARSADDEGSEAKALKAQDKGQE